VFAFEARLLFISKESVFDRGVFAFEARRGSDCPVPIDSPYECEHNNPDSPGLTRAVAPAVTMDEAVLLFLFFRL